MAADRSLPVAVEDVPVRNTLDRAPLRMVDLITGAELLGSLRLMREGAEMARLRPGDLLDARLLRDADAAELVRGQEVSPVPWPARAERQRDGAWILRIPDCSLLLPTWADADTAGDLTTELLLCMRTEAPPPSEGPHQGQNPSLTPEGRACWDLHAGLLQVRERCQGPRAATEPTLTRMRGPMTLFATRADGAVAVVELHITPGETRSLSLVPRVRPLLRCVVLDESGAPVANARVTLTVGLDNADYDRQPGDGHGFLAVRRGEVLHQGLRQSYRTDADGSIEIRAPRGAAYSLEVHESGLHAWWSRLRPSASDLELPIMLQLAPSPPESTARVQVRGPGGAPWAGGSIVAAVAGDVSLFRQWSTPIPLDTNGTALLPGAEPGTRLGVSLRHPSLKRGTYAPPYPTVESDGSVWIQVPESELRQGSSDPTPAATREENG